MDHKIEASDGKQSFSDAPEVRVLELNDAELALVGGGIGETVL